MGSSLQDLKNRIKSINTTGKITKAMQLISAARLKNIKQRVRDAQIYMNEVSEILADLLEQEDSWQKEFTNHFINKKSNKTLVILFTSDRGLCGHFNGNLIKKAKEIISNFEGNFEVLAVGKRGYEAMKKYGAKLCSKVDIITYPNLKEMSFAQVSNDIAKIVEIIGDYANYLIIHANFVSMTQQDVAIEECLFSSLKNKLNKSGKKTVSDIRDTSSFYYDSDIDLFINKILSQYAMSKLFNIMMENILSEYSARMLAMDAATRNSIKMLDKLKREYNQRRQGQITKELIEIISGMEAIEG